MKIRVKFSKHGPLRFIGHLDIMRYFQKAIRRSGIDIAYSTGFSPHQIMSFAAPLGVGMESDGEYFDMEVHSVTTAQDMVERLNKEMVEGMEITGMFLLPDDAKNAMASVKAASYCLVCKEGVVAPFDFAKAVETFLSKEEVLHEKQTAKSVITRNLREAVYELKAVSDKEVYMLVDASSAGNVKPGAVMETLAKLMNAEYNSLTVQVIRIETYTSGLDGDGFIPLGQIGSVY